MSIQYPVYQPYLVGNEKNYVNECLDSQWISSQGRFVGLFESAFAEYLGMKHAISCSNGTTALHLALLALGLGEGDEILVPCLSYVATANAVTYVGARPVFIDAEAQYFQIDTSKIECAITAKTKAIIVTHLYGHACDMEPLLKLAQRYQLALIEDCAEAIGTTYNEQYVGTFGDIACFSFFGNKTITTGEGGMVVTARQDLAERVFQYKGQGVSKTRRYYHEVIGYNYRMTNICCAIGLAQLENIHVILEKKQRIASMYQTALAGIDGLHFHSQQPGTLHTHWLVSILVDEALRDKLMDDLLENGIETRPFFVPMHQLPIYPSTSPFPVAERLSLQGINLPSYPALSQDDVTFISEKIQDFYLR